MSKFFLLIPGARLPESEAAAVLASMSPEERAALDSLGTDCGRAHAQRLDEGVYARAPHLVWLWRVITRRDTLPAEAPWRWLALGGREQAPELWSVSALTLCDNRVLETEPTLSDDEFMQLTIACEPLIMKAGFRLQIWDNRWFATRREDWACAAAPRMALTGLPPEAWPVQGPAGAEHTALTDALREVLRTHPVNEKRRAKGLPTVDALWLSGGGHEQLFFPPTLIRSVAADDDAVRGWANASGILLERLGRDTGSWPEAPAGDIIAVCEDLYPAWLQGDWDRWRAVLPALAAKVAAYRRESSKFQTEEILPVLFGRSGAVTLAPAQKGLMDRLFGKKTTTMSAELWCADCYDNKDSPQ